MLQVPVACWRGGHVLVLTHDLPQDVASKMGRMECDDLLNKLSSLVNDKLRKVNKDTQELRDDLDVILTMLMQVCAAACLSRHEHYAQQSRRHSYAEFPLSSVLMSDPPCASDGVAAVDFPVRTLCTPSLTTTQTSQANLCRILTRSNGSRPVPTDPDSSHSP